MSRRIMDGDFRTWEVFVNTGPSGFATPPRLVFRCVSDPALPSRMAPFAGERTDALRFVEEAPGAELASVLDGGSLLS